MLTFVEMPEILRLEQEMTKSEYVPNTAQKLLASQVTELIHGKEGVAKALSATQSIMPGKAADISAEELKRQLTEVPSARLARGDLEEKKLVDIIAQAGFMPS